MLEYAYNLVSVIADTGFLILIPNVVAGVALYFMYGSRLQIRKFTNMFVGFGIYVMFYILALVVSPIILGLLMGGLGMGGLGMGGSGIGFLWIFGVLFGAPLCIIGYLAQLFVFQFIIARARQREYGAV